MASSSGRDRAFRTWRRSSGARPRISFSMRVQSCDAFDRFGRNRRVVRFHQLVELAPDVSPAGGLLNAAILVQLVEAGIGIGLQNAA